MELPPKDLQPKGLDPRYKAHFSDLIRGFVGVGGEPFDYEAALWRGGEHDLVAGTQRVVPELHLQPDEKVSASVLNRTGRARMREVMLEKFGQAAQPLMYVEVEKNVFHHMSFAATAYVLESGDILTWLEWNIAADSALSDESRVCYEFARDIGLGDSWVQAMFESDNEGSVKGESLGYMDAVGAEQLLSFLNTRMNGV